MSIRARVAWPLKKAKEEGGKQAAIRSRRQGQRERERQMHWLTVDCCRHVGLTKWQANVRRFRERLSCATAPLVHFTAQQQQTHKGGALSSSLSSSLSLSLCAFPLFVHGIFVFHKETKNVNFHPIRERGTRVIAWKRFSTSRFDTLHLMVHVLIRGMSCWRVLIIQFFALFHVHIYKLFSKLFHINKFFRIIIFNKICKNIKYVCIYWYRQYIFVISVIIAAVCCSFLSLRSIFNNSPFSNSINIKSLTYLNTPSHPQLTYISVYFNILKN